MTTLRLWLTLPLLVGVLASTAAAEPLRPGLPLPAIQLDDQHGAPAPIGREVRLVLFTRDMDGGNLVKAALAEDGAQRLAAASAVYVSDISRMPGLITRIFALPSLRKRPYRIVLDRDGEATAAFPAEAGKVTVLTLADGSIQEIQVIESAEGLRALLAGD